MAKNSTATILTVIVSTTNLPITVTSLNMFPAFWLGYIGLFLLRFISFITTCTVIYSIIKGNEFLNPIIRTCMCAMYCSSFISDISYCIVLFIKIHKDETFFVTVMDLMADPSMVRVIFWHEFGFATFGIGIFLTATERLLNSRVDFYLQHQLGAYIIAICLIPVILACSAVWAYGLTTVGYNVAAAIVGVVFFLLASAMLFLAVYFNIQSYRKGLGQSLELRFKSASTYYFNRHLFISLVGEICMRSIAYSFIFSVATSITLEFDVSCFLYHNLLAVGNIIFPWLIILRRGRSTVMRSRSAGVTDLTGNQLRLRANTAEYHNVIAKMWQ